MKTLFTALLMLLPALPSCLRRTPTTSSTSTTGTTTFPRKRCTAFEASCNCRLKQDYYSDNEEMLAKLEAGAVGYDLIVPTGNAVESLIRGQALRQLDKTSCRA
jgi:spermidine/putrescine transport system substrate-binding protein